MDHYSEEMPHQIILRLYNERAEWSDEAILAELTALPVLPDEKDDAWNNVQTWQQAYVYLAVAHVTATRQLRPAIPLLLERACYGDPGEIMRGLRHSLEQIVAQDWDYLAEVCAEAAKSPQPGARLWAIDELGILRDSRFFQTLVDALDDKASLVRREACSSLLWMCQQHSGYRQRAIEEIRRFVNHAQSDEAKYGQQYIEKIERL